MRALSTHLLALVAGACLAFYVLFHWPVKQDLFSHALFSATTDDLVVAYWLLAKNFVAGDGTRSNRAAVEAFVTREAPGFGLDPALVKAVVWFESGYRRAAISTTGAMGLMALMPEIARRHGATDPFQPFENLRAGMRYLAELAERYDGNVDRILAAYNAGEDAVTRHDGVPPFPETEDYVERVKIIYAGFRAAQVP